MSIFSKLINWLRYKLLLSQFKPELIAYRDSAGNVINKTRVSNLAHISNKKNVTLGENVFIGHFNYVDGFRKVTIGRGSQLTNHISLLTHSSHNAIRTHGDDYIANHGHDMEDLVQGDVSIGEYTFVGPHVTIMPGTTIGKNCIIGAFSYVQGDFDDNSILRGTPAIVVGSTKK